MGAAEHWGVEQLAQEIALDKAKAPQWFAGLLFCNSTDISFHQINKLMKLFHFLRKVVKDYHQVQILSGAQPWWLCVTFAQGHSYVWIFGERLSVSPDTVFS